MSYQDTSLSRQKRLAYAISRLPVVLEKESLESSLTEFAAAAWPNIERKRYFYNWHIGAIARHLEAVSKRQIKRLIINVPPRSMKSTLVNVAFPAWTWTTDPGHQFLCGSHAEKLAVRDNLKHRRLISSPWYQARWGDAVTLTSDQNQKTRFENSAGGYRIGFGMTSGITGDGGDTIIIDDPHDRDSAQSELERERALETFDQSVMTRLNNPNDSAIVVIMQRLHEDDLSGHLLAEGGWEHLMLPMEYDPRRHCVTSIGQDVRTEAGELLWPERFSKETVEDLKKSLGPYGTSGQLQQIPTPAGGAILKSEWWECWDDETAKPYGLTGKEFPAFEFVIASLDTAYTAKAENDYSALTIWAPWTDRTGTRRFMLVYSWQKRLEFNDLVEEVSKTCRKYKVDRLLIENKAVGHSIGQEIRRLHGRERWSVQLMDPGRMDKVSRAHSIVALLADKMVWAPDTVWAQTVIDECSRFPKGSHDDLVDSVTQALKWLRDNDIAQHPHEQSALLRDAMSNYRRLEPLYPGCE